MSYQKSDFLDEFGGSVAEAADAIGVTRMAIYLWPDELHDSAIRRIRDYYLRTRGAVPKRWMPQRAAAA